MTKIFDYAVPVLCLAWLMGSVVKDRWWVTSFAFYVPPLFLVVMVPIWLFATRKRMTSLIRVATVLVALLAAVKMLHVDVAFREPRSHAGDSVRLVHWNTMDMPFGISRVMSELRADEPDICVLSELRTGTALASVALTFFPGGDHYTVQNILLFTRYPIEVLPDPIELSRSLHARLLTEQGPVEVLAVDLSSSLWQSRKRYIDEVNDFVRGRTSTYPLIVVGDFNTPRDSVHFDALRTNVRHAYEDTYALWPYSWPLPLPLYSIDHLWVSPDIDVQGYALRWSVLSDHLRQVADLAW